MNECSKKYAVYQNGDDLLKVNFQKYLITKEQGNINSN